MKNFKSHFIFSSIFLLLISSNAHAGDFSICNDGDRNLAAVYVMPEGGLLWGNRRYTASGRYFLSPGKCTSAFLSNMSWGYYGVYDADAIEVMNKISKDKFNRPYDQDIFEKLPTEMQGKIDRALFPYKPRTQDGLAACASSSSKFEYSKPSFSELADCGEGYFRVLILVRSRGGDNDATMHLK